MVIAHHAGGKRGKEEKSNFSPLEENHERRDSTMDLGKKKRGLPILRRGVVYRPRGRTPRNKKTTSSENKEGVS